MQILTKGDPIPGSFLSWNIYADLENFGWPLFPCLVYQLCSKNVGQDLAESIVVEHKGEWKGNVHIFLVLTEIVESSTVLGVSIEFGSS